MYIKRSKHYNTNTNEYYMHMAYTPSVRVKILQNTSTNTPAGGLLLQT